ncbi:MAG: choice-of-anchor D domain-containing protein [Acidobacteriota bacterium]|nr:choice-of-anchor D domain-containing protein [Acidobacteriota bacterium]
MWTTLTSSTTPAPQVTLTPSSVLFGNQTVATTSAVKTITLMNSGTSYLSLLAISISGANAADFLESNTCGAIVPSGATCTLSITFKPSTVTAETASLTITGNQPGSPTTVSVTGSGVAAITSGGLTLTPSSTFAGENGQITISSNKPVNWSLANGSSGTLTSSSSTSATFAAPASIPAQNVIGSCQATPNDSVYNTRIDNLPVESHSSTWTVNMGTNGISFLTSWGTNIADSTTPVQNMSFYYTVGYNGPFVFPQWPTLKREGGTFGTRLNDTDHHVVTVRRDNCQFYETYNDYFTPSTCRDGVTKGCNAQSGLAYGWNSYTLPTGGSTDAAGLPLAPLTLHLDEIKAGAIKHAMRFTVAGGYIHALPYWPANSSNGCSSCVNAPPYGARFRLKASYDISKFSPTAQVILTALKQYGMFLADAGTGPTITASTDTTEDPTTMGALGAITGAQIGMTNFEAVDESSFMVSSSSAQVNPANGYQTPSTFAVLTATDQSNSNYQVSFPIALQSVIVGIPSPTMYILAGLQNYQLTSWVTGNSNQNTTWSLVSGVGSVTAGGAYTPPGSVASPSSAVLQVASAADPTASTKLYVTVLPVGSNPAGSIRIDSGNPGGSVDNGGNTWLGDQAFETGAYAELGGDYPNWPSLNGNPERVVYQSAGHTYGNDIVYSLIVPNGNYKVRLMLGQPYNGCTGCATFDRTWHAPINLEANGQIAFHNFDFGFPISYAYATPIDVYMPAQVTNNSLTVALRINLPDVPISTQPSPTINGVEIVPDAASPHLAIDTQQKTSLTAGNTLQLYSVGWYMSNAVTWSISGPGSISQTGLYTAPVTASSSAQTVTITATSTATSGVQATATLTIPASGS